MNLEELTRLYDLTGRTVVITGGAGVIGGEIACALVGCNANVAILDRDPGLAKRLVQRIDTRVGKFIIVYGDVLDLEKLTAARDQIFQEFGNVDTLINAAGGNDPQGTTGVDLSFFDVPQDALRYVFDLNVLGTILASQVFGKAMADREDGTILNISSMSAFRPMTRVLASSKASAATANAMWVYSGRDARRAERSSMRASQRSPAAR